MSTILHIAKMEQWEAAKQAGTYRGDTLDTEGFIHCSTIQQVIGSANKHFDRQKGLVLLYIASDKVKAEIKYEGLPENLFPHIYGALNIDAVIAVVDFEPGEDGKFEMSDAIANPISQNA